MKVPWRSAWKMEGGCDVACVGEGTLDEAEDA